MAFKHVILIAAILLAVVLVVGLILCRPMGPENYARGIFNFGAVREAYVRAWTQDPETPPAEVLRFQEDSSVITHLTELFDGRGFGRTPGTLFSDELPEAQPGDMCWEVTFRCTATGSWLSASYTGGGLVLSGADESVVTTQDKEQWAEEVYSYILTLYPEPEEPQEPEEPAE